MKRITLAQMTSVPDISVNLKAMMSFIDQAAEQKSDLIAFPENCLFLGDKNQLKDIVEPIPGKHVELFQTKAREKNISILLGSLHEISQTKPGKANNTSVLIDRKGNITALYRKIHLFDVRLPTINLVESELIEAGNACVTCQHDIGTVGLTICYDLRFPTLYQKLTTQGAQIIFVPAAFTVPTGKAHWLTLLQARAIENQVYMAAPAQVGRHSQTRESFGKSVIIDPWGEILALAPDEPCLISAEIDLDYLNTIRQRMPVLSHRVKGIDW